MDFKHYQYVLKVAELQNMTKAANELYVSQPALSHYIAKLEDELGAVLFNRNTTPLTLTPAGERYVETARMVLALNDRLRQDISDINEQKKGRVVLGISHARASFFLPYVLPEFQRQYPGIEVKTVEIRSDKIEEYVSKGKCDIGILPLPLSGAYALEQEIVCREELFLVSGEPLPQGLREDGRAFVNLEDCGNKPYLLLRKGHGIRSAVDVLFLEHGISPSHIFETTSNETAYRLSSVGMGISIVPESTILLSHAVTEPFCYHIGENDFFWRIGAVYRQKECLTKAQRAFIGILQQCFDRQLLPEGNAGKTKNPEAPTLA